jgi:hypothetical protein
METFSLRVNKDRILSILESLISCEKERELMNIKKSNKFNLLIM